MIYEIKALKDINADTSKELFCDTETIGLYGQVRLLQIYQEGWDKVALIEWPNIYEMIAFLNKFTTVWHNVHYDNTTCQQQSGTRFVPNSYEDTFFASRLAQPQFDTYSLDDVMARVLGYDPYTHAGLDKKTLQKSNWDKPKLTEDQLLYAAIDVYYLPHVWEATKHVIDEISYKLDKLTVQYRHARDRFSHSVRS